MSAHLQERKEEPLIQPHGTAREAPPWQRNSPAPVAVEDLSFLTAAEFSQPVNHAEKVRILGAIQQQHGNLHVQRALAANQPASSGSIVAAPIQPGEGHESSTAARDASASNELAIERGGGSPLDDQTRSFMESRFGSDFTGVRVHTDSQAHEAAKSLGAEAFTTGRDIYFNQAAYDPSSPRGRGLIAHELAHVVQQAQGASGGHQEQRLRVSQPTDPLEREADTISEAVTQQPRSNVGNLISGLSKETEPSGSLVQLQTPPGSQPATRTPARGVIEYPVARERPLEATPTGIEGSAHERDLIAFAAAVDNEIDRWIAYRGSFAGPLPGRELFRRALEFERNLRSLYPLGGHYDPRVHLYLARRLGRRLDNTPSPERLYLLQEMASFGFTAVPETAGVGALLEIFNMSRIPVRHSYECDTRFSSGGYLLGGTRVGSVIIQYHNNLGMRYSQPLRVSIGLLGYGADEVTANTTGHGVAMQGSAANFWAPQDFVTTVSTGNVSVSMGQTQYTVSEELSFAGSHGPQFRFNLAEEVQSTSPGLPGATLLVGVGVATSGGHATATAAPVPPPVHRRTGNMVRLLEAHIYFDTGQATLTADSNQSLANVIAVVRRTQLAHPEFAYEFRITGNASPRWRGVRRSIASDLNEDLAMRRAMNTLEQARNAFRGDRRCDFTLRSCPGPAMSVVNPAQEAEIWSTGSGRALAEGADPNNDYWQYRRVDIEVYYTEYGVVTEHPPPRPTR